MCEKQLVPPFTEPEPSLPDRGFLLSGLTQKLTGSGHRFWDRSRLWRRESRRAAHVVRNRSIPPVLIPNPCVRPAPCSEQTNPARTRTRTLTAPPSPASIYNPNQTNACPDPQLDGSGSGPTRTDGPECQNSSDPGVPSLRKLFKFINSFLLIKV